jgi:hypothetical protein
MANSSGTTNFFLSNASIAVSAFARLQIRRTALLAEHMQDAYNEFNLMLSSLSNLQPNLWTVNLVSVPLVAGTATYSAAASTIMVLDAYISYGSPAIDRILGPISRTDYASYPNKQQQGVPTSFWFDRTITPSITLWTVPDSTQAYTLNYYCCSQVQDANLPAGEIPNVPYRFLDLMVAGLSHRLSRIWKPELEAVRKADADAAWQVASTQDVEDVPLNIVPQIGFYRT